MSSAPPDLRRFIYDRDGGRCKYCNVRLARDESTIDHYLPTALGGTNAKENLRLCCWPCNNIKGSMHPTCWAVLPGRRWHVEDKAPDRAAILARLAPCWRPREQLPEQAGPEIIADAEARFSRGMVFKPGSRRSRKP